MKGGPFGDIKKIAKRSLTKPKKITRKLVNGGTRTHVLPLGRPQKAVTSMPVWFSVSHSYYVISLVYSTGIQ